MTIGGMEITTYKCTVSDKNGTIHILYKDGNSEKEVFASFINSEYIPLQVIEKQTKVKNTKNEKAVLELTQMMEQLINSGLSLKEALEITSQMNKSNSVSGKLAKALYEKIQKGISFAKAVNSLSDTFPAVYRGIISVGDRIGSVERIFPRLRIYLETQKKIKEKVKSALLYPCIVLITAILGMFAMIFFVFPKLEEMFSEFGGDAVTILQSNIHNLKRGLFAVAVFILIVIIGILILRIGAKKSKTIREEKDRYILKSPVLGKVIAQWETLNFSFAMETLTSGGITVEAAIPEAITVVSNCAYKKALKEVSDDIIKGESLSEAFSKRPIFPEYMSRWILVGEKSGQPEHVFSQIRNYYQAEIEKFMNKFMTLIEPSLILLIGIFMIILILTVIVPVFSIYGSVL